MTHSPTPDILSFSRPFAWDPLTAAEVERLRQATLQVLDEVGVAVPSGRARDIFAAHGARVGDDEVVRIPPDLVAKAMATAPRSFVLAGREPRLDLLLDGSRSYICTEGVGVHVVDPDTRELRASRKADIERLARVADALPLVAFFWSPVSAQDHGVTAPLHECHAGLTSTHKHVRGGTTVYPQLARYVVELATVAAGGDAERRRRPPICANICTISPLAHDKHGLECALEYAAAGIPVSFMAMPTMGSVAPATLLGALVQGDAEVVSGMVLLQLAAPGTPVFHSVLTSLMNPHSGGYLSEVPVPADWISVALAHAWGVPSLCGGSVSSDAAAPGWQSGVKTGFGGAMVPLAGGEICGDIGMAGGTMVQWPEQMILDHEALLEARALFAAFPFDERDLALDAIREVGPRGHFLKHRHTRENLRRHRLAPWVRQGPATPADGEPGGGGTVRADDDTLETRAVHASAGTHPAAAGAAALEEFRRLDREHHPAPLPADVLAEMDQILDAADREAERIA